AEETHRGLSGAERRPFRGPAPRRVPRRWQREILPQGLQKGRMMTFGSPAVRWTYIHPDDVARCLAMAIDDTRAVGRRIDLGTDRPVSAVELASTFTRLLRREVRPSVGSLLVIKTVGTIGGLFLPFMRDMMAMGRYFETGKYVADTKQQGELFGPV